MPVYLTKESVLAVHEQVLKAHGGGVGVRDHALLESALAAPQATFEGSPVMLDGVEVAAAYLFYLCKNHPFIDGNKRTALACCLVFLSENGLFAITHLDVDLWESFVMDVAASRIDRKETTKRLRGLIEG